MEDSSASPALFPGDLGAVPVVFPRVGDKTKPTPRWSLEKKAKSGKKYHKKPGKDKKKKQLREHWEYEGWCTMELSRYSQWEVQAGSVDAPAG